MSQASFSPLKLLHVYPGPQKKIGDAGGGRLDDGHKSKVADRASAAAPGDKYHVVASVDGGLYTEWQVRICYYHYKKMKRQYPDSPMGGFTRLLHRQAPFSLSTHALLPSH